MEEFLITLMVILAITNCCLCICITWLIEKLGGVLGGILACIPSTLVVVVWGQYAHHVASLSWSLSSFSSLGFLQYQKTLMSIPLGMGVNSLYLFLWKVVPNFYARWFPRLPLYGLLTVVFLTNISAWFTCTVTLQYLLEHLHASSSSSSSSLGSTTMDSVHEKESPSQGSSFHPSLQWIYILGLSATVMAWVIGAGVCWAPLRAPKGHARTPWYIYLIRGLGTGCTTGTWDTHEHEMR
ncbi:hypothetical protein HMI56_004915 [Coelomomyces lativittatus]|nr:hypothetical protein HMI56_004915 [Coelomomyces lativittatus]